MSPNKAPLTWQASARARGLSFNTKMHIMPAVVYATVRRETHVSD